jgi:hypothetical protein
VFDDVPQEFWGHSFITALAEKNIISVGERTFRPNDYVTREEFVKLLVLAAEIPPGGDAPFTDAEPSMWYYPYIAAAYHNGVALGNGDGTFGVGDGITRQDMAVLAARLLEAEQGPYADGAAVPYADGAEIAAYAYDAVARLTEAGIMSGNENRFMPVAGATRAEAAKIIALIDKAMNGREGIQ